MQTFFGTTLFRAFGSLVDSVHTQFDGEWDEGTQKWGSYKHTLYAVPAGVERTSMTWGNKAPLHMENRSFFQFQD